MVVAINPWPAILLSGLVLLGALLAVAIVTHRRSPRERTLVTVLVLAGAVVAAGALFGLSAYQTYQATNTWTFRYMLDLRGNGTQPESLIVPVPADEGLLAGLQSSSGTANWSFVDTPHGRGLFVRFTQSAILQASESAFPPPAPIPDTTPTMPAYSNCTADPYNCTELPELWVYYSGTAGVSVWWSMNSWSMHAYPVVGWGTYVRLAAPVPMV